MIVSGLVFAALFKAYTIYLKKEEIRNVKENIKTSAGQVSLFYSRKKRYPCPADRSLGPNDANYGKEFDSGCDPSAIGLTLGNCTANDGICMVEGAEDRDNDGTGDPVFIGALPVHDLREANGSLYGDKQSQDSWNGKLLYAVSANLTQHPLVNPLNKFYNGVIDAKDEHGFNTAGITNDGHYVILSHGPDRKGAFTPEGQRFVACGPPPIAEDNENCDDDDATFVQALGIYQGDSARFYDDFAYFATMKTGGLWSYYHDQQHVYNLNTENVGIKTETPDQQLTVDGAIRVDNNALATEICNSDGSNCFPIQNITGSNIIRCNSANQVMDGIDRGRADCVTPSIQQLQETDCGEDRWVRGVRTDGSVICWP